MYRFADELEAYADEYLDGDDSQMLDDEDEDAMREAEYLEQIRSVSTVTRYEESSILPVACMGKTRGGRSQARTRSTR